MACTNCCHVDRGVRGSPLLLLVTETSIGKIFKKTIKIKN
jgi:hypothetical protein